MILIETKKERNKASNQKKKLLNNLLLKSLFMMATHGTREIIPSSMAMRTIDIIIRRQWTRSSVI